MDEGKGRRLLRKSERQAPDQDDGEINKERKGAVLKFARQIATSPGVRTEQRPLTFRPAPGDIGEDRKDRDLIIVFPKQLRIVEKQQPDKENNQRAGSESADEISA